MVEKRKLFFAISMMLLTRCQIITMLPHNVASTASTSTNSNNSENNNAQMLQHDVSNTNSSRSSSNNNNNNDNDSDFLITVAERNQQKQQQMATVPSEGVWETQENDSIPTDNIDDLIFVDKRPINQHHQHEKQLQQQHQQQHNQQQHLQHHNQHQHQHQHHHHHHQHPDSNRQQNEQNHSELHHVTMDAANSNSNGDEDTENEYTVTNASDDAASHDGGVTPLNVTTLDLSDFLSLIPATKVKAIVNHYYQNDPEVQRAHAFMSSRDFIMLKQHIIAVPEVSAFLHYLNSSGLDLVKFVTTLTNLTSYGMDSAATTTSTTTFRTVNSTSDESAAAAALTTTHMTAKMTTTNIAETNDIEYAQKHSDTIMPTPSNADIQTITTTATTTTSANAVAAATEQPTKIATESTTVEELEATTAKEHLNGLHGLVDSVLDVLPQDQILATFFDKLESNEQFSKLIDSIGSPEFAKILNNMQKSMPLRNLIFTLHNNGIYVIRIVDSLKSYFFLGGF